MVIGFQACKLEIVGVGWVERSDTQQEAMGIALLNPSYRAEVPQGAIEARRAFRQSART